MTTLPVDSFLTTEGLSPLSELADLSEISEGGPPEKQEIKRINKKVQLSLPEMAFVAFSDVRLTVSASNSRGPGLTRPVYF